MTNYRLRRQDEQNIIIEKFIPSKLKPDGSMSEAKWASMLKYYGRWEDAIKMILNQKIVPVGDDLQAQLEDMPNAIERAKQEIIDNITILDNSILIS